MIHSTPNLRDITRRHFFSKCGMGLGSIALASLLGEQRMFGAEDLRLVNPMAPKPPHFAAKAKNVIFLFMAGGPSQLELFDYKPGLAKWDGKLPPAELLKGYRAAFIDPRSKLLGPKFKFARHGKCGARLPELTP